VFVCKKGEVRSSRVLEVESGMRQEIRRFVGRTQFAENEKTEMLATEGCKGHSKFVIAKENRQMAR
jgi:hypothetical protein